MPGDLNWRVMGIDPGASGALATLCPVNLTLRVDSIPVVVMQRKSSKRKYTEVDGKSFARLVLKHSPGHIILEQVGVRPEEGAGASFSFGHTFGTIRGVLDALDMDYQRVRPEEWKRETKTPADKALATAWADRLFPLCKGLWRGPRGGLQHDRAEAAIMALYGIVLRGGTLQGSFRPEED